MRIIIDARRQLSLDKPELFETFPSSLHPHPAKKITLVCTFLSLGKTFIVKTQQNERPIKASEIEQT